MQKVLITTAIDYVNDVIHLGHIYQKIAADVLARYYRLKLGEKNVYFLTGTDEHGLKAQTAALNLNKKVKDFVDEIAFLDRKEQDLVNISYNRFIRTTDQDHIEIVKDFWLKVFKNGDIYLGDFQGFYCEGCEAFKTESEIVNNKCPLHFNQELKLITEKNYFFKWSKYKYFLKEHILKNPNFVQPDTRRNEVLAFVDKIEDITISRKKENIFWGIEVPNDQNQVIYVWFDALINYFTGGWNSGFWDENTKIIHILGKDNLRWHALLWPAMLKSAGYKLPDIIYAHGFITLNGLKISKSLGNIIRPSEILKDYNADVLRYYLIAKTTFYEDADVSLTKIKEVYNADLANGLGNLISRVFNLVINLEFLEDEEIDKLMLLKINKTREEVFKKIEEFKFFEALNSIWQLIKETDIYINEKTPWKTKERKTLFTLITIILNLKELLKPFLPETALKIDSMLLKNNNKIKVVKKENIFPRK